MSNFFLLNETINNNCNNAFKEGMSNLVAIDKNEDHVFRKHTSVYDLKNYADLFSNYGQIEQVIVTFIEQLSTCDVYINSEELANDYCKDKFNGFLGIDFHNQQIPDIKKITCDLNYKKCIYFFQKNIDKLKTLIPNHNFSGSFEKEFSELHDDVQISIVEEFNKAKDRNLATPFYPDTKIIKDVTQQDFNYKILELRVYTPVALRVYFNELNGKVNLISIEQKSNPNQSEDIKSAHKRFKKM